MPVLPVAPGTLTTGNDTFRSSSIILPDLRATWSAPPPGPQGTMYSMGRDGYLSSAAITAVVTTAATHASSTRRARPGTAVIIVLSSSRKPSIRRLGRAVMGPASGCDAQQQLA